jgi:hypothetical protein
MRIFKKIIIFISFSIIGILMISLLVTGILIGTSVGNYCQDTTSRYQQQDCVTALMTAVEDESLSFGERNSAIWALGQLGDSQALPILEKYYSDNIPDQEPWNEMLSKHEVKKAVKLLNGGLNITAFTWRWGID